MREHVSMIVMLLSSAVCNRVQEVYPARQDDLGHLFATAIMTDKGTDIGHSTLSREKIASRSHRRSERRGSRKTYLTRSVVSSTFAIVSGMYIECPHATTLYASNTLVFASLICAFAACVKM